VGHWQHTKRQHIRGKEKSGEQVPKRVDGAQVHPGKIRKSLCGEKKCIESWRRIKPLWERAKGRRGSKLEFCQKETKKRGKSDKKKTMREVGGAGKSKGGTKKR